MGQAREKTGEECLPHLAREFGIGKKGSLRKEEEFGSNRIRVEAGMILLA